MLKYPCLVLDHDDIILRIKDDCIPFEYSSGTEIVPQWKEHSLSELLNRRIRIVVELNGAVLHSISATARPHILQRQRSFSDPQGI